MTQFPRILAPRYFLLIVILLFSSMSLSLSLSDLCFREISDALNSRDRAIDGYFFSPIVVDIADGHGGACT